MIQTKKPRNNDPICPYCSKKMVYHSSSQPLGDKYGWYECPRCEARSPRTYKGLTTLLTDENLQIRTIARANKAICTADLQWTREHPDEVDRIYLSAVRDSEQEESCITCRYCDRELTDEPCAECTGKGIRHWHWRGWLSKAPCCDG